MPNHPEKDMSIKMADGVSVPVAKVGKWFLYGFVLFSVVLNVRGIAGLIYSMV